MVMESDRGDDRPRRPRLSHPWIGRERRVTVTNDAPPRNAKACMAVSSDELHAIRARAGAKSVSEFLRAHLPEYLFQAPDHATT